MAKHSMSTAVEAEIANENEVQTIGTLYKLAEERMQGQEGLALVSVNRVGNKLLGTFTRNWETPDPKPETEEEEED